MPVSSLESWTLLGDDELPVAAIKRYLAHLTDGERFPNTINTWAHDLKDYFTILAGRGLDWREVPRPEASASWWPGYGSTSGPSTGG